MAAARLRIRPLVVVVSRVPLFVEALAAAFTGIADLHAIAADDLEASGLVRAFRPDAVIAEGDGVEIVDVQFPYIRVDLAVGELSVRNGDSWLRADVDLSPEAIRNVVVDCLYRTEPV